MMIYEKARDASRPWGYWLVKREWHYHDEGGRAFSSVRHALWTGRLGMPASGYVKPGACHGNDRDLMGIELDRIGACLAAVKRGRGDGLEQSSDLFAGIGAFRSFYGRWLEGQGLISQNMLTAEGAAVLRMLAQTRPRHMGFLDDGAEYAAPPEDVEDPSLQAWFRRLMRAIDRENFRFVRVDHHRVMAIELIGDAMGEATGPSVVLDVGRVIWTQTFADAGARDRLYRWLCIRMDRWGDWGRIAYRHGPGRLSARMLELMVEAPLLEPAARQQKRLTAG